MHDIGCEKCSAELVAWLDGALTPLRRADVARHLDACPSCRQELAWIESFARQMERRGADVAARLPRIDVREQVFAAIRRNETARAASTVTAFRPRREVSRFWMGFAAAAALAVSVWLGSALLPGGPRDQHVAHAPQDIPSVTEPVAPPTPTLDHGDQFDLERRALGELRGRPARSTDGFEETAPPELGSGLTAESVLQARREAETLPDALQRLSEWAHLSLADAQRVAGHADATLAQQLAASEVLPIDEAIALLERAVMENPDDLTARFALAKAYSEREGMEQQALGAWAELARLDPGNSTPYMEMAALMFARGEVEEARWLLQHAASLDRADVYAASAAQYRREALVAAGMTGDAAALVSAFTAGSGEYDYLSELSRTLLAQADYYRAQGDVDTAQAVYEALLHFGQQVDESADFSLTQLAGLDAQRAAAESLESLYVALGESEAIHALTQQTLQLVAGIDQIGVFFDSLNGLFGQEIETVLWVLMADFVLSNGDLRIFDFVRSVF